MYCSSCKTRISPRDKTCAACGKQVKTRDRDLGSGGDEASSESSSSFPLPPSSWSESQSGVHNEAPPKKTPAKPAPVAAKSGPKAKPKARPVVAAPKAAAPKPAVATTKSARSRTKPKRGSEGKRMPSNEAELELQSALPEFLVNPEDVRNMIVSEPSVIEPGLRIEAHGAALESDVGTIDLLARDSNGALVVVMVAEPDSQKEVVSEILPRLGWVRKHRAKKGQEVRAIVLLESEPEDLGYEASALADTLSFQVYRVALSFEPVEV